MKTAMQLKNEICPICERKGGITFYSMNIEYSKDRDECERSSKYFCSKCGEIYTDLSDIVFYVRKK